MKNKQGYFDDNNQEYVITDMFPRRDLLNYLWNGETVCALTQFGDGNCWVKVGQGRRQLDMGPRLVYIKDNETGAYYSASSMSALRLMSALDTTRLFHVMMSWNHLIAS